MRATMQLYLAKRASYEAPHYAVFSNLLPYRPSSVQICVKINIRKFKKFNSDRVPCRTLCESCASLQTALLCPETNSHYKQRIKVIAGLEFLTMLSMELCLLE
jgi:hypothetical protein